MYSCQSLFDFCVYAAQPHVQIYDTCDVWVRTYLQRSHFDFPFLHFCQCQQCCLCSRQHRLCLYFAILAPNLSLSLFTPASVCPPSPILPWHYTEVNLVLLILTGWTKDRNTSQYNPIQVIRNTNYVLQNDHSVVSTKQHYRTLETKNVSIK